MIAFAILGAPRTSRQSRALSLGLAIAGITVLRFAGFACVVFAVQHPQAILVMYGSIGAAVAWAVVAISRGATIEPPAFLTAALNALTERLVRRLAPT